MLNTKCKTAWLFLQFYKKRKANISISCLYLFK